MSDRPNGFYSTELYFPGWVGIPRAFANGAVWSPHSISVHQSDSGVIYENIWVPAGNHLQLELPWGKNYESQSVGERLLAETAQQEGRS